MAKLSKNAFFIHINNFVAFCQAKCGGKKMNRIRYLRLMAGKTLDHISQETGIDIPRLSRIERSLSRPINEKEKKMLALAFGLPVGAIFPEE